MFGSCSSLEMLSLPAATSFNVLAIQDCPSLTTLQLNNLLSLEGAISCPNLENLAIPAASIDADNVFQYCAKLKNLVIGSNAVKNVSIGTIPNNTQLTVYVPNSLVNQASAKISPSGMLFATVMGYNVPTIKSNLFFTLGKNATKNCVVQPSSGTEYVSDNPRVVTDVNGNVTFKRPEIEDYHGSIRASNTISVGPFSNLIVNQYCRVSVFSARAYASSFDDGSTAKLEYGVNVYSRPYLGYGVSGSYIQASQYSSFIFRSYDDEW